ncbi:MAG: T9SS type A sorting domain-containing protein [Bacteroidetes bacterium]|nr:T9SS type A sorting domain-containing protein [Bacteroidota bacterium]
MKKKFCKLHIIVFHLFIGFFFYSNVSAQMIPFSTDSTHITVWNGETYSPLFIKGINLGIAKPGTFPGELLADEEDYLRWFSYIHEAGFNTIRLYTLHFPQFYTALKKFNDEHRNSPILVFHGVWLEEEHPDFSEDLFGLTQVFDKEISDNIRAIHGDISIPERQGKAYGSYTTDISEWVIGYIIGREIHPPEVVATNAAHSEIRGFYGEYFSILETNATEAWLVGRLNNVVRFEMQEYGTQRPVSASSWPTLDPLSHPEEKNTYEDEAQIDFSKVDFSRAKAGFFISYHAYPYYPDFVSRDPIYQGFADYLGQNSYLGYLYFLKEHYQGMPLIIAEFGAPSSWGIAHYAQNGIHHGGLDENEQGLATIRMLKNIEEAGGGGGITFAFMDEWFKRTWIADPLDFDPERRIIWHNAASAEQNFGLIGFKKDVSEYEFSEVFSDTTFIQKFSAGVDFTFLNLEVKIKNDLGSSDTLWIAIDTYDKDLGESVLGNKATTENRAEFMLRITSNEAELWVTQAYDVFEIWDNTAPAIVKFQSVKTDGSPWNIVRRRNNVEDKEVQYVGNLRVNRLGKPQSSLDGVRLYDDRIKIRLPWNLLNIVDPSRLTVLHDSRGTEEIETRTSDGIQFSVFYKNERFDLSNRYVWTSWNHALDAVEYKKDSYFVMQEDLTTLPGSPVAFSDTVHISVDGGNSSISLLANDFSYDGSPIEAVLVKSAANGIVQLAADGMFSYLPESGYSGTDSFKYRVVSGVNKSEPVTVHIELEGEPKSKAFVRVFPNPVRNTLKIESETLLDSVIIYTVMGRKIGNYEIKKKQSKVDVSKLAKGVYFILIQAGDQQLVKKITVI